MTIVMLYICIAALTIPCTRETAVAVMTCVTDIRYTTCPTEVELRQYPSLHLPSGTYQIIYGPRWTET